MNNKPKVSGSNKADAAKHGTRRASTASMADERASKSNATQGVRYSKSPVNASAAKRVPTNAASKPRPRHFEPSRRSVEPKPKWPAILCTVCVLVICGLGYAAYTSYASYQQYMEKRAIVEQDVFYDGTYFEGYSLAGMTLSQATSAAISLMEQTASSTNIVVQAGGETFTISSKDVSLTTNLSSLLAHEYNRVHSGSLDERYSKIEALKQYNVNLELTRGWDEATLRERINAIADAIYKSPLNAGIASFKVSSSGKGTFTFSEEQDGFKLDIDDLYEQVSTAVAAGHLNASITAATKTLYPEYDVAYMESNFGLISSTQTNTTSNGDRNNNIKLATATFNGRLIQPGETFSFNESTGERTTAKGYKPAGAYSNGVLVLEPGGGVCQVSTTLYNTVAKADLEIVDRSPHSRPISYVGIGLDAAVNWPNQDFQFKNNTGFPIYVTGNYSDQKLTIRIYGHKLDSGISIKLTSEKTETIPIPSGTRTINDKTIPTGETRTESGREGYRAVGYKVYYNSNDEVINKVKLANSYYAASQETERVGTG